MAPADPKEPCDPKPNKDKSVFDQSFFIRKPCAFYNTYTWSFFTIRSESCEFLGQFLTYSWPFPPSVLLRGEVSTVLKTTAVKMIIHTDRHPLLPFYICMFIQHIFEY